MDDPVLREHFKGNTHLLIRRQAQQTLEVLRRIEQQKRFWICSALVSGRVELKDDQLHFRNAEDNWAAKFFEGQKSDVRFQRLLTIAEARPQGFTKIKMLRPELAVWQKLCAANPSESDLLPILARMLHRSTPKEEHKAMLAALPKEDAKALRAAKDPMSGMLMDWPKTWPKKARVSRRKGRFPGQSSSLGSN